MKPISKATVPTQMLVCTNKKHISIGVENSWNNLPKLSPQTMNDINSNRIIPNRKRPVASIFNIFISLNAYTSAVL